jgi:hypothetical protein
LLKVKFSFSERSRATLLLPRLVGTIGTLGIAALAHDREGFRRGEG